MANSLSVLDHGFVTLLNLSGPTRRTTADTCTDFEEWKKASIGARSFDADDVDPAQSARMSFNQRDPNRERSSDLRLNSYLMKHHHTTPIEMIETWWEMKLPIFVARQFVRHRTVSINEVSARYTTLPEEWYIPEPANVGVKSASNKQGRTLCIDGVDWDTAKAELFCRELNVTCKDAYAKYKWALENNIPPEVARSFLHVNHYTHWLWKQNLHNLFHFLALRDHSHAQWESQQYAKAMIEILRQHLPNLMNLYDEYRRLP